ncbi:MAG: lipase family protein [Vicinamibacterales bacterium]
MARTYEYATSRQALYQPAAGPAFFEDWTAADLANPDLLCAEVSRLSYAPRDVATQALENVGFTLRAWVGGETGLDRLRAKGTDGFVATRHDDAVTVAAFRGTEANKPEDLLADLVVVPTDRAGGGQVHKGFAEAYAAERDQVLTALDQHSHGQLFITGHSLGAALATLGAADHQEGNPTLITFGSPRVGDEAFKARLDGIRCRRFVNCCDMVTRIPPPSFAFGPIRALLCELADASRFTGSGTADHCASDRLVQIPRGFNWRRPVLTCGQRAVRRPAPAHSRQTLCKLLPRTIKRPREQLIQLRHDRNSAPCSPSSVVRLPAIRRPSSYPRKA